MTTSKSARARQNLVDPVTSLKNLKLERDAIVLYEGLAGLETDERRASAFRQIAANERRHAEVWAAKLRERGVLVPRPSAPGLRVRFIILMARLFGTHAVTELVQALEGDEEAIYERQTSPEVAAIAADEREHAQIWRRLSSERERSAERDRAAERERSFERDRAAAPIFPLEHLEGRDGVAEAERTTRPTDIGDRERWHRSSRSGTLRAVIFGVSDGLVSNLALVMGVAGATTDAPRFVLLAGIAGLLAGAFSMAAGEYVSMQSQRELFTRQIELERAEMEAMPEEEQAELAAVYRSKGFTHDEAAAIAARIFRDPEKALDTLVREELGLDPNELGSPWGAAGGSFLAFAIGAAIPVVPYLTGQGGALVFAASLGLSLAALFAVGAGVSLLTGRSTMYSGLRQVGIGLGAAAVTYVVGRLIGVTIG
ncbi:MAG: VIT1/CCC1 transporter family protein [Chloroflexota bacterium]